MYSIYDGNFDVGFVLNISKHLIGDVTLALLFFTAHLNAKLEGGL